MLRYETKANVTVSIDLQNDYSVIAMARWDNAKGNTILLSYYMKIL